MYVYHTCMSSAAPAVSRSEPCRTDTGADLLPIGGLLKSQVRQVARELGVPNAEIRDGLEAVTPLFGRSQVIAGSVTVIADCYNANPDSMDAAVQFLDDGPVAEISATETTVLVDETAGQQGDETTDAAVIALFTLNFNRTAPTSTPLPTSTPTPAPDPIDMAVVYTSDTVGYTDPCG